MKTSKFKIVQHYSADEDHRIKKYVFLFLRKVGGTGGSIKRDWHIIFSSCPDNAYDQFIDFCERKHWSNVSIVSFSRIFDGFKEDRS